MGLMIEKKEKNLVGIEAISTTSRPGPRPESVHESEKIHPPCTLCPGVYRGYEGLLCVVSCVTSW